MNILRCWMSVMIVASNTKALLIEPLASGIQIQELGNVFIKAFDLDFGVVTSINVTKDVANLFSPVHEISTFCDSLADKVFADLKRRCNEVRDSLKAEESGLTQSVGRVASKRRHRRFAPLFKPLIKVLGKYAPHIIVAGTIMYQTAEIAMMERNIDILKQKLTKLTQISLKLQNFEFSAIDSELSKVHVQERLLQIDDAINGYAIAARILFADISSRYSLLDDACPLEELKAYLQRQQKLQGVILPPIDRPCDLFTNGKYYIKNDIVEISFKIGLVSSTPFTEFIVTRIPFDNFTALDIGTE